MVAPIELKNREVILYFHFHEISIVYETKFMGHKSCYGYEPR